MDNIKVSVIVPVYNAEKYLKRCVDSLLAQTYSNIEIVLINDGSKDNSDLICKSYEESYPDKIVFVNQNNSGAASARNNGMKNATGDYIGFVDADDYVKEDMFEALLSTAVDNDCDMVNCGHFEVAEDGKVLRECTDTHGFTPNELVPRDDLLNRLKEIHKDNLLWFTWRNLYSVKYLKKYNITYNENDVVEDPLFNLECLVNLPKIVFIDKPYYYYVLTNNSLTRKQGKEGYVKQLENTYNYKVKKYNEYHIDNYKNDFDNYTISHTLPMLISNIIQLKNKKNEIVDLVNSNMIAELKYTNNTSIKNKIIIFLIRHKKTKMLHFILTKYNSIKGR